MHTQETLRGLGGLFMDAVPVPGDATYARPCIVSQGLYPSHRTVDSGAGVLDVMQVNACRGWIRMFGRHQKACNRHVTSYGLKHRVENFIRCMHLTFHQRDFSGETRVKDHLYIANGAFIEGARLEGYRVMRASIGSPNACFDMRIVKTPALQERPL